MVACEDCDDGDGSVSPAGTETWYDGIDGDCDGASDYDQDGEPDLLTLDRSTSPLTIVEALTGLPNRRLFRELAGHAIRQAWRGASKLGLLYLDLDGFKEMIGRVQSAYPEAEYFATTLREVISANTHMWGALVTDSKDWEIIKPREIGVLDRIGGGDGFVGGLLYGILIGFMCALIRVVNPAFPEGMMLAILFANVFAALIDWFVVQANIRRRARRHAG